MQIAADTVVAIDYTLKSDDGEVLDSSDGHGPLVYLHGHSNIVEGLEAALAGHVPGDDIAVTVPPEKGYGVQDAGLVFEVPKEQLPPEIAPMRGMPLAMNGKDGGTVPVRIKAVKLKTVEVDANHELAGVTLHFAVTVRNVRKATAEELQHGHAHGEGGHHH